MSMQKSPYNAQEYEPRINFENGCAVHITTLEGMSSHIVYFLRHDEYVLKPNGQPLWVWAEGINHVNEIIQSVERFGC